MLKREASCKAAATPSENTGSLVKPPAHLPRSMALLQEWYPRSKSEATLSGERPVVNSQPFVLRVCSINYWGSGKGFMHSDSLHPIRQALHRTLPTSIHVLITMSSIHFSTFCRACAGTNQLR